MATTFEDEVLSRVAEDYEAAHTITSDISRDLGWPISEEEVRKTLLKLAKEGRVQASIYETEARRYRAASPAETQTAPQPWFKAVSA
jgi:hypothetical protein